MEKPHDHPNMLGAAILALVLGAIMLGLSVLAKFQGQEIETNGILLGACLLALGVLAFEKHKELKAMSPEARAKYWADKQKSWEATAESRARAELGDDYRPKR